MIYVLFKEETMAAISMMVRRLGVFIPSIIFGLATLLLFSSCTSIGGRPEESYRGGPYPPPMRSTAIYDFKDVIVPRDLKVDKKESYIYTTGDMRAGILRLKGKVDAPSLTKFFEQSMPQQGWTLAATFRYHPRSLLLFEKEGLRCLIQIFDHIFSTEVEIWLAPTEDRR